MPIFSVKLINSTRTTKFFGLLLTLLVVISCKTNQYHITKINSSKINVNQNYTSNSAIENFIEPYRKKIDADLNTTLAISPENLDKSKGEWQTNIGSFLADITLKKCNFVFETRHHKKIDFCLLNHGGIRSSITKGNVTTRNAYEVMPFENSAVVIGLNTNQIIEIANYIINEKKPHPLSGMTFTITKNNEAKDIKIQGKPIENDKIYYVVTSDYLANGGDNMVFFTKATSKETLDYKLRNILIDYLKEVDVIELNNSPRITKE